MDGRAGHGTDERTRFVERIGQQFEADGLTRIAGRIFGHLLLTPDAQSLDELARALDVSKASVSQETRTLERKGALQRVRHARDRRAYWKVAEQMEERMLMLREARLRETRAILAAGHEAAQDAQVRERLERFCSFQDQMIELIGEARARWRETRMTSRRREPRME